MTSAMPPHDPASPTLRKQNEALRQEVQNLRLQLDQRHDVPSVTTRTVLFSYHGVPVPNDESGRYIVRQFDAWVTEVLVSANAAASAASAVSLRLNGTEVHSTVIPSGSTVVVDDGLAISLVEFDQLSVAVSAVGAGLATVTIQVTLAWVSE